MKCLWSGTDSLMLIDVSRRTWKKKLYWMAFRVLVRLLDVFVECHYADAENIADNLRKFGLNKPIEVKRDHIKHTEKFPKVSHEGFNVIYYAPKSTMEKEFVEWLYGLDVIDKVKRYFKFYNTDINFIELNGSADMSELFPAVDMYIRPNRHDGASRLRQECEIQEIPYYWTNSNPSVQDAIKAIEDEYKRKSELQ